MTEETLVKAKKQFKEMIQNLDKANQLGIMKNGELIKLVDYDEQMKLIIEMILRAALKGMEL